MRAELRRVIEMVRPHRDIPGALLYRCNICGMRCRTPMTLLDRETPTCRFCQSSARYRSIISVLSRQIFGRSILLPEFPERKDLVGIGLSDWYVLTPLLARKFSYQTTYLHQEPRLDIRNIDPAREKTLDFLICSEVFEHVAPPVSLAFRNARRLLKDTGFMIFTAPYVARPGASTVEHFPRLHEYVLSVGANGKSVLMNTTVAGEVEYFEELIFHGGDGLSLEMRLFSEDSLMSEFRAAGFRNVSVESEPDFEHGVFWKEQWSLPILARP
jgi:SAM-dependent methyltransferase